MAQLPWWFSWYRICLQCRRLRFDPWVGISPGEERQPTPVFLPGESHGQRSLAGYGPWSHKEWDSTEQLTQTVMVQFLLLPKQISNTQLPSSQHYAQLGKIGRILKPFHPCWWGLSLLTSNITWGLFQDHTWLNASLHFLRDSLLIFLVYVTHLPAEQTIPMLFPQGNHLFISAYANSSTSGSHHPNLYTPKPYLLPFKVVVKIPCWLRR